MTDERSAPPPPELILDGCPEEVRELAASCIDFVHQAVGFDLDMHPDTLSVLDHYLTLARLSVIERPELLPLLSRAVGAYFGEIVRREYGGYWHTPSSDSHEWKICLSNVFLAFNPVGFAHEALTLGLAGGGPSSAILFAPGEQDAIQARLSAIPPVPEDEYFSLCTRWEVLEIAHETLRNVMRAGSVEETVYEVEDYAAVLRPEGQA